MKIIAIDPGLTGAIATNTGIVYDLPTQAKGRGNSRINNELDGTGLYNILYHLCNELKEGDTLPICYVEEQVYRKKFDKFKREIQQGGSSIFSLGDTYGISRAYQGVLGMQIRKVLPHVWKRSMKLPSDKEVCRAKANEFYPQSYDFLKRKMDHNRAEALLLAKYGEMKEMGLL